MRHRFDRPFTGSMWHRFHGVVLVSFCCYMYRYLLSQSLYRALLGSVSHTLRWLVSPTVEHIFVILGEGLGVWLDRVPRHQRRALIVRWSRQQCSTCHVATYLQLHTAHELTHRSTARVEAHA